MLSLLYGQLFFISHPQAFIAYPPLFISHPSGFIFDPPLFISYPQLFTSYPPFFIYHPPPFISHPPSFTPHPPFFIFHPPPFTRHPPSFISCPPTLIFYPQVFISEHPCFFVDRLRSIPHRSLYTLRGIFKRCYPTLKIFSFIFKRAALNVPRAYRLRLIRQIKFEKLCSKTTTCGWGGCVGKNKTTLIYVPHQKCRSL